MATIICEKAEANIPKGKELAFLETMHRLGEIELIRTEDQYLKSSVLDERKAQLELEIQLLKRAVARIEPLIPKKKLLDKIADHRQEINEKDIQKLRNEKEQLLAEFEKFEANEAELLSLNAGKKDLESSLHKLEPFKKLAFSIYNTSSSICLTAFTADSAQKADIQCEMEDLFDNIELFEVNHSPKKISYIAAAPKEMEVDVAKYIEDNTEKLDIPNLRTSFDKMHKQLVENLNLINESIEKKEKMIANQVDSLKENSDKYSALIDVNSWEVQEVNHLDAFKEAPDFSQVQFWLAPEHLNSLKKHAHAVDPEIKINLIDIPKNEKKVKLKNTSFVKPFEGITRMMGFPASTELDPTPILTPFFILFFGLALSDAGYGLILVALTGYILWRKRLTESTKSMMIVLFWCGLSTVIFGGILGSWFGFIPDYYTLAKDASFFIQFINPMVDFLKTAMLIDPTANIPIMLGIMISLGGIHLFTANIAGFIGKIKHATVKEAIVDSLVPAIFIASIALFALTLVIPGINKFHQFATYFIETMILLMIVSQGSSAGFIGAIPVGILKTFMSSVGLLSETLSYSRLLALGIATGIIANVIDTLAFLTNAAPFIGPLFVIIVMLIGHTINILINVLGAFISSARLHFVEFFPKFMSASGKPIIPFARSQNHLIIVNK